MTAGISASPSTSPHRPQAPPRGPVVRIGASLLWPAILTLAIAAVYSTALHGGMILDDSVIISNDPSIRNLRHLGQVLAPPHNGSPTQGRPLVHLTFALNYALGREEVFGYHLFNVAVHLLNALLLFGIVRRTLRLPGISAHLGRRSSVLAFVIALLWGVHPLATAAVDYISERTESVMSLFFLLMLYCMIRSASGRRWPWSITAVIACLCGMASKEVMVVAPLVALLYDRAFLADTWKQALRERGKFYAALAATWAMRAALLIGNATRGGAAGFGGGTTSWRYLVTQCAALVIYLKLTFWPRPLVFDYGTPVVADFRTLWPQALLLGILLCGSLAAFCWRPRIGFLGAVWFIILAPSSSFIPLITQTIGEHRVYLPLAAAVAFVVVAAYQCGRSLLLRLTISGDTATLLGWSISVGVVLATATALGSLTVWRHRDYRNEFTICDDVIHKYPSNAQAYNGRGNAQWSMHRYDRAMTDYATAIRLKPDYAEAYNNRGSAYYFAAQYEQAIADYGDAIRLRPDYAEVYNNRGRALFRMGRYPEAVADYGRAIQLKPDFADACSNRGNAYFAMGRYEMARYEQAITDYTDAIRLKPDWAEVYNNRGDAYGATDRYAQAIADYGRAIQLKPDFAEAYGNRSLAYFRLGDYDHAWADIRQCRRCHGMPNPELLRQLTQASNRSE